MVSAKLSARAALAATGSLPELAGKLPDPHSGERKFEDVVKDAQQASVLVLVY